MRTKLIAGNWKMNKTPEEAKKLISEILPLVKSAQCRVMIAPSFVCLSEAAAALKGSAIVLAAQNMADHEEGAYTGEVSPAMLKNIGVKAVILGHSERRQYYHEDDALINRKVKLALSHDLEAVLCVGETLEEKEADKAFLVVGTQLREGLKEVSADQMARVVVAYEPVWAIGTGKTASVDDAEAVHKEIRRVLTEMFGAAVADKVIIQYGGSVKPENVKAFMAMPNIDGALVGGASLKADSFGALVNY